MDLFSQSDLILNWQANQTSGLVKVCCILLFYANTISNEIGMLGPSPWVLIHLVSANDR